jgi:hypothetical protein
MPTVFYKEKDADDNTYTSSVPVNAGIYTKKAELAASGGFSAATATVDFVINKAMLTVTTFPYYVHCGTDPAGINFTHSYDISGFVNGEDETVLLQRPVENIAGDISAATPPGVYPDKVLISGGAAANYTFTYHPASLTIFDDCATNQCIPFNQVVIMRWNNTLTVVNNPANNGGYTFTSYKWYRNGQEISTEQSWSAGAHGEKLNPADVFHVELTAEGITGILRSCDGRITLKSMEIKAWPNPVSKGETLYVEADVDEELLQGAVIEVYNISGNRIDRLNVQGRLTPVSIKYASGAHFFVLIGKDGFRKELKIVVQ